MYGHAHELGVIKFIIYTARLHVHDYSHDRPHTHARMLGLIAKYLEDASVLRRLLFALVGT